jgi:hypothetical protein
MEPTLQTIGLRKVEDNNIRISVPEEVTRITDKANLLKSFIEQLVTLQGG